VQKYAGALCAGEFAMVKIATLHAAGISNLSVEWIDREHFVEPSMCGFRLVKKPKIEPTIKEDEEIPF
jgi:hypothetical protein